MNILSYAPVRAFGVSGLAIMLGSQAMAQQTTSLEDIIIVNGQRLSGQNLDIIDPLLESEAGPDTAAMIARVPGGGLINNGPLSGQVSYRGLFGPRVNLTINNQQVANSGPGMMDPPMHFAPAVLVDHIKIDRGVSPVSKGPGLAGGAHVVFKSIGFADTQDLTLGHNITVSGRSVDSSYALGGVAGASNDIVRVHLLGSLEKGGDIDYPSGTIANTRHERASYGLGIGMQKNGHTVSIDLRHQDTSPSGNAPAPMDIDYFDADFAQLSYNMELDTLGFDFRFGYADVVHGMTNFHLRTPPAPAMMRSRSVLATAETIEGSVSVKFSLLNGEMRLGGDMQRVEKSSLITNPHNSGFSITNFPKGQTDRTGLFAEWHGVMAGWNAELGSRIDWHTADIQEAHTGPALPAGIVNLASQFNGLDRSWDDATVDGVLRLWRDTDGPMTWRATLARKSNVYTNVERYAWVPMEASSGLWDGNIYLGSPDLKPEKAWIIEGGFDYRTPKSYVRPTIFYRAIDDYIQGVPFDNTPGILDTPQERIAAMNGDSTPFRFGNVDAKLYGMDMDFGFDLDGPLRVDGVASFVRGKRRDINDYLYRVTPPSVALSASYEKEKWSLTLEGLMTAKQSKVSASNSETPSDGYSVLNFYGKWNAGDGVMISAGIENLFDTEYTPHLAGRNRVRGSDVPLGVRVPGAGRGLFAKITWRD